MLLLYRQYEYNAVMSELWIPNSSPSHDTLLYDAVLAAQTKVNTSPE